MEDKQIKLQCFSLTENLTSAKELFEWVVSQPKADNSEQK